MATLTEDDRERFLDAMIERRKVTVWYETPSGLSKSMRGIARNLDGDLLLLDLGDDLAGLDLDWVDGVRVAS
jgi:hypothetical protein